MNHLNDSDLDILTQDKTSITTNKFLVQLVLDKTFYFAYHCLPNAAGGNFRPWVQHENAKEAFLAVLKQAQLDKGTS